MIKSKFTRWLIPRFTKPPFKVSRAVKGVEGQLLISLIVLCLFSSFGRKTESMQLSLSLMERRDAASYKSWDNIRNYSWLHYKKFIKEEYEPDGHRNILYRFNVPNWPEGYSRYWQLEIISMKGRDTLHVTKENRMYYPIGFVFDKKMYNIEKQIVHLTLNRRTKFSFMIFFDIENFVGEE